MPAVKLPLDTDAGEVAPIDPSRLQSGAPQPRYASHFSAASGSTDVGVWESAPGSWAVTYTETEICLLLSGRVRLVDEGGAEQIFGAGDCFLIPSGYRGVWETIEFVRKLYVIHEG